MFVSVELVTMTVTHVTSFEDLLKIYPKNVTKISTDYMFLKYFS